MSDFEFPDLLAFLLEKYQDHLQEHNPEEAEVVGKSVEKAGPFVRWARDYLSTNRPALGVPADNNFGVTLLGGERVFIAPAFDGSAGSPDAFNNVDTSGSLRISAPSRVADMNQGVDYRHGTVAIDKSASRPAERMDRPGYARDILNS